MNSFAHYSFGAVCEWMFAHLAGIDTDGPGYERILIRPTPPSPNCNPDHKPIDWVRAHYDSIHGRIGSEWKSAPGRFELKATIPANTTGTVYLPVREAAGIRENGRKLDRAKGATFVGMRGDRAVINIESGDYHFTAPW